jgi:hypothetical protein
MEARKGEQSTQGGAILLTTSALFLALYMQILDIFTFPLTVSLINAASGYMDVGDILPVKILIPLSFVSYIVWRIVRYISLELYLNN